jgi:hypothetical protein
MSFGRKRLLPNQVLSFVERLFVRPVSHSALKIAPRFACWMLAPAIFLFNDNEYIPLAFVSLETGKLMRISASTGFVWRKIGIEAFP